MAGDEQKPVVIVKRKKRAHATHHSGAWKVAYADFVTAMMALFMVLWLLTQADMKLRQQIAQYFRDQGVLPGGSIINPESASSKSREPHVVSKDIIVVQGQAEQERLEGEKKAIEEHIKQAAEENPEIAKLRDQVIVQVTDAGLSIQVVDKGHDMLFDLNSAELKPVVVELLKHLAAELGKLPNHVQVGGHTDSRPFPVNSIMTNWDLAFARANAARRVLEANGLWPGQINRVVGYADSEPLIPENPLADENRRLSLLAQRSKPAPAPAETDKDGRPLAPPIVLPADELPGKAATTAPPGPGSGA